MKRNSHASRLSFSIALGICTLGLATAAASEATSLRAAPTRAMIRIAPEAVSPDAVRVEDHGDFRFLNEGKRRARVIFDRKAVRKVDCSNPSAETGRRGQYLVEPGDTLDCHADARSVSYTVYRQNDEGRLVKTEGKVRIR